MLWAQQENSVLTSRKTFSFSDGYLIYNPYHSIYDSNGWLWILGENKLSDKLIFGGQKIIIQRFDGANFFKLKLPNTSDKKIKDGHFFKDANKGLYLKLYYQNARAKLFYINTESLEIHPVKAYNALDKKYIISKAYHYSGLTRLILTSKNKFYSADLNKLKLTFVDSIPFDEPVNDPLIANPVKTDDFVLIKLLFENEISLLNKEGKFVKKLTDRNFETSDGTHFYPAGFKSSFKIDDDYYAYIDDYQNAFKFDKADAKFVEIPNTDKFYSKNESLEFTPDFKHVLSTDIFSDYTAIKMFDLKNFKKDLLAKVKVKNYSKIAYREFGKDLVALNGNTLESYSFTESKIKTFLKDKSVRTIKKFEENKYIVATDTHGLYIVNVEKDTEKQIKILTDTTEIAINYSRDIFIQDNNTFIIGGPDHLYTLDKDFKVIPDKTVNIRGEEIIKMSDTLFTMDQNGIISKYSINENTYTEIANTTVTEIKEFATDGTTLYATSSKGIFEYKNGTSTIHEFENIETDHLLSINYLEDYGVLVSTKFGRIYTFDTTTKKLTLFYEDELNASIVGMLADDNGKLWLNTYAGIISLHPVSKKAIRYTAKDGIYELQGNRFSTYKDKQDESILMGSSKGLSYFKPDEVVENDLKGQPKFTSISLFNSDKNRWEVNTSPVFLNNTSEVVLPSEYRRFSTTLSVFGQMNPQNVKYRYRLLNSESDKDWFIAYPGKELLYANLEAGTYTLEVEAFTSSQQKIGERITLKIISEEFFYKTWWFVLLLLVFISLFVLYLLNQYKVKRDLSVKREMALNEAKVKSSMMLEIHHRVRNNLQIVSGLLFFQMAKSTDEELKIKLQSCQSRIESIAGIHNLLYNSNNEEFISVKQSIETSVAHYQKLFSENVNYHLDIDASFLSIDQVTSFSLLLNELINNSIKHAFTKTASPEIFIHFKKQGKTYVFTYFDNGCFKKQENQKESMGMKIIEMMSKQLKGELKIENTANFKLTLLIPTNE